MASSVARTPERADVLRIRETVSVDPQSEEQRRAEHHGTGGHVRRVDPRDAPAQHRPAAQPDLCQHQQQQQPGRPDQVAARWMVCQQMTEGGQDRDRRHHPTNPVQEVHGDREAPLRRH